MYSQGLTMDHCSIYELTILKDWFDDYEWNKGKDHAEFSISTDILAKVLSARQPSQQMIIEYSDKPDSISIKFVSSSEKTSGKVKEFPKEFMLPLIDVESEHLEIPEMEYSAEFGIESKALHTTNEQLSLFNETLTIHCSEDEIYLRSKGNDGELKVTLFNETCEHITEFALDEDMSLTLDFSIKHFNTFCRFLKVSNNVMLGFTKNRPMKFEYIMDEQDGSNLKLSFYLAPKINDDDDDGDV
jgi:proliferating cell nuclear antigen